MRTFDIYQHSTVLNSGRINILIFIILTRTGFLKHHISRFWNDQALDATIRADVYMPQAVSSDFIYTNIYASAFSFALHFRIPWIFIASTFAPYIVHQMGFLFAEAVSHGEPLPGTAFRRTTPVRAFPQRACFSCRRRDLLDFLSCLRPCFFLFPRASSPSVFHTVQASLPYQTNYSHVYPLFFLSLLTSFSYERASLASLSSGS